MTYYIGIDVGKYKLDIYNTETQKTLTIKNERDAITEYIKQLKQHYTIIIDLTGGYEKVVKELFYNNKYKVLLAEGIKVKHFTKTIKNKLAKTDKIDSMILTEYAKHHEREIVIYEPNARENLQQLYNTLQDLKQRNQQQKNRLKQPNTNDFCLNLIKQELVFLKSQIDLLKQEILKFINSNQELKLIYDTLLEEDGVGPEIAIFLIAKLKELGKVKRKQLTAICGLAPQAQDSGTITKHRYLQGGRQEIKSKLYFLCLNKMRFNKTFQNKIQEMSKRGKNKKVALLSLARKQIIKLNAILHKKLIRNVF